MESLSKTTVSLDTAGQIIRHHLGQARKIERFEELKDGFFNAAYFLQLDDGLRCVLKVAPAASVQVLRYERNIMRAEVDVMRLVKERTQMPVPAILCHDDTGQILPNEFFIMDFVDGVPLNKLRPSLSQEEQAAIDGLTGDYLRQMNLIRGETFGYYAHPDQRLPRWQEAFDRMLVNVLQDGQDFQVDLGRPYEEIHALLARHYEALDEVTTPKLVHWDLWDGNIFVYPETKLITGIIDFERALWADPLMECNFGAFGINPAFIEGYGLTLPFNDVQSTRRALYNAYLYLIMVIECYFRHYPTKDQENWVRGMLETTLNSLQKKA